MKRANETGAFVPLTQLLRRVRAAVCPKKYVLISEYRK